MYCAHCGKAIEENECYYRAGKNGTVFCSQFCCYESLEGLYTKNEVDKTLESHTLKS